MPCTMNMPRALWLPPGLLALLALAGALALLSSPAQAQGAVTCDPGERCVDLHVEVVFPKDSTEDVLYFRVGNVAAQLQAKARA